MKTRTISLLPLDKIQDSILEHIDNAVQRTFQCQCHILPCEDLSSRTPAFLHEGKYNSTAIILYILEKIPVGNMKILAVTQRDLYSPIFSYLYGEAQLNGAVAVMSLHRLRPEFYSLPSDHNSFLARCEKQAIHELGHTSGLVHCKDKNCVMYPSSTIDDTDEKAGSFCPACTLLLED